MCVWRHTILQKINKVGHIQWIADAAEHLQYTQFIQLYIVIVNILDFMEINLRNMQTPMEFRKTIGICRKYYSQLF